jgi:tRNA1Val (adenine37-N6)-methyltransferase
LHLQADVIFDAHMKKVKDFIFKQFKVSQEKSSHKVGTDGVLLGAWASVAHSQKILDIGAGSGVIALMLAQRAPNASVDALEIQEQDALQAEINFQSSPWKDRLRIHHTSLQQYTSESRYDLIVSNPPYFINSTLPPVSHRSIVRHTHTLSFGVLLEGINKLLSPHGIFAVILPVVEGKHFISAAKEIELRLHRICEFKSRAKKTPERLLMEFGFSEKQLITEELILYRDDVGEEWSDDYKALTREFYLKI